MQNYGYLHRVKFDQLAERFKTQGVEVQPSYLRYEQALANGVNHYEFAFEPSPNDSATEKKLNKNDLFYVTSILLGYVTTGTTVGTDEEGKNVGVQVTTSTAPIHTYVDASKFTDGYNLEAIYNGFLRITTGSKINIENLSTLNFKYVPQNAAANAVAPFQLIDALYGNISDLMLAGTKSHTISVDIPAVPAGESLIPSSATVEAGTIASPTVTLVLQFEGYLMKNGAIINQMQNV